MLYTQQFDRQEILGMLKRDASLDKDVVHSNKMALAKVVESMRFGGTMMVLAGVLFSLTIVGAVIGIPLIWFGRKVKRRATANGEKIEVVYAEYLAGLK